MTIPDNPFDYYDEYPDEDPFEPEVEMTIEVSDPFSELVHDEALERDRAEVALIEALENYVAFGATYDDVMKIVGDIL